jgi:hypothetical protein
LFLDSILQIKVLILVVHQMITLLHLAIKPVVLSICVLLFFLGEFNYYYHHGSSSVAQVQQKVGSENLVTMIAETDNNNNLFQNLAREFSNAFKRFEYTVDLNGKEIFANDTLKQDVVTDYKSSTYNIRTLKYKLLGFDITASDIKIEVKPSRIDALRTKIDLPIVLAKHVSVTNGLLNLKYSEINLGSIYGIYDKTSDKMTVHIPFNIALHYLPRSL